MGQTNGGRVASEVYKDQVIYNLVCLSLDFELFPKSTEKPLKHFNPVVILDLCFQKEPSACRKKD